MDSDAVAGGLPGVLEARPRRSERSTAARAGRRDRARPARHGRSRDLDPPDRRVAQSLVLGTDKDEDGALVVFDLQGRIVAEKTVRGLRRPNNVDAEYSLWLGGAVADIAVATERYANKIRVYRLPDMKPQPRTQGR